MIEREWERRMGERWREKKKRINCGE